MHEVWPDTFVGEGVLVRAIFELRRVFEDEAREPRVVQTIAKRGYRLVAPVEPVNASTKISPAAQLLEPDRKLAKAKSRKPWRAAVVLASVVILVGAGYISWRHFRAPAPPRKIMLAVLPFENLTGDPNKEYLADGLTEETISQLGRLNPEQLGVIARTSVMGYKHKDERLDQIGRDLSVQYVLENSLRESGDHIRLTAQLIQVKDQTHLWSQDYDYPPKDILNVEDDVAKAVVQQIRLRLTSKQKAELAQSHLVNPEAFELYLKGRYSWNQRTAADLQTAISYFNQAIAKDPGYAFAYLGLADAYSVLPEYGGNPNENIPKANAAARKALELDALLARPHTVLGGNAIEYDWDFARGEAELKKALELDPNDATTHQWYAESIGMMGGREAEALAEARRGYQLDPLSPIMGAEIGEVYAYARHYDDAISACLRVAKENPTFGTAHVCLLFAYWGKKMYPQVIQEWKAYGEASRDRNTVDFASALERGYRSAGWKGAVARGIEARQRQRTTAHASAYDIARLYADLGDKDQAFKWLNSAYEEHASYLYGLKTDCVLDPIRSDPRFAELVRKVGLPQ